jgi:hypothetical protein
MHRSKLDEDSAPKIHFMNEALESDGINKLASKIPQAAKLPGAVAHSLEVELREARDVGYVLSKIEIARDILAAVANRENDCHELIKDFLARQKIKIRAYLKGLRHVELTHIDALIRFLGLLRAKLLVINREDPFITVLSDIFKEPLKPELLTSLDMVTHHIRPEVILESLYNFIMEKLSSAEADHDLAEICLRDLIFAHLDEKDESSRAMEIQEHLNKDIQGKHAASCFINLVSRNKS